MGWFRKPESDRLSQADAAAVSKQGSHPIIHIPLVVVELVLVEDLEAGGGHPSICLLAGDLQLGVVLMWAELGVEIDHGDAAAGLQVVREAF